MKTLSTLILYWTHLIALFSQTGENYYSLGTTVQTLSHQYGIPIWLAGASISKTNVSSSWEWHLGLQFQLLPFESEFEDTENTRDGLFYNDFIQFRLATRRVLTHLGPLGLHLQAEVGIQGVQERLVSPIWINPGIERVWIDRVESYGGLGFYHAAMGLPVQLSLSPVWRIEYAPLIMIVSPSTKHARFDLLSHRISIRMYWSSH